MQISDFDVDFNLQMLALMVSIAIQHNPSGRI